MYDENTKLESAGTARTPAMVRTRKTTRAVTISCLLFSVVAVMLTCTPAVMVNVWRDPGVQAPRLNKLLVIAVRAEPIRRRMWEDAFSAELAAYGVTATQSYRLYPGAPPDTSQIREALTTNDLNGVLVAHPLPATTESYYVHGYNEAAPAYGYDPYWGRYYHYWHYVHHPGYVESVTTRRQQIDLYMAQNSGGRLVWSGTTAVTEPGSAEALRHDVVTRIVPVLSRQGMIPPRQ
jgi:hypothetical protein